MLTPDSVTVPAPFLCNGPVPASTALTEPACTSNVPLDDNVPFEIVPPVSVKPPFCVWVVVPRSSVPPATVTAFAESPSVPLPDSASVPALTVVPPE